MNHRSLRVSPARLDGLVVPLQHALGVGEAAVLLGVRGGGQEEHLGADVLGAHLPGLDLRPVLPPGGGLDELEVAHDQPVEVGHAQALHLGVGRPDGGVLAEQEVALALARDLGHHRLEGAVAAGQPRQVVEAEAVVRGRRVAPPRLEQAHQVGAQLGPVALVRLLVLDVVVEVLRGLGVRHRDVAGQDVEQRRDVGASPGSLACPRRARIPPPGRPMLPSSVCRIDAARTYCTPTVWWVQPTE